MSHIPDFSTRFWEMTQPRLQKLWLVRDHELDPLVRQLRGLGCPDAPGSTGLFCRGVAFLGHGVVSPGVCEGAEDASFPCRIRPCIVPSVRAAGCSPPPVLGDPGGAPSARAVLPGHDKHQHHFPPHPQLWLCTLHLLSPWLDFTCINTEPPASLPKIPVMSVSS